MAAANPSIALSKRESTLGGDNHMGNESFREDEFSDEDGEGSYSLQEDSQMKGHANR